MEVSQETFEQQLMERLLQGEHPVLATLRQQYVVAKIVKREFSGVGFFSHFDVPENVPLAEPPNFEAGSILIHLEKLPSGAGCILFVRKGKLDFLECYTFVEPWPERIVIRSFSNVRPAIPE